jgi:hypothetical protein
MKPSLAACEADVQQLTKLPASNPLRKTSFEKIALQ